MKLQQMVANLPALPPLNNNNGLPSSNTDASLPNSSIVNLDRGDTVLLESYWRKMSEECTVEIKGWEFLSYASDLKSVCWFMMPELRDALKRLHALVGNAETSDRHIVVGNGSTQLFQAALFALSSSSSSSDDPINVVAAAPYYSGYPDETDLVRSSLHKWSGDAKEYDKNEAYIEIVTSPNNPDGSLRGPVVSSKCGVEGKLIHDLAYYWPLYTPITHKADHDLMLFTLSKCTGHSGSRIGWAIVKDIDIAKKMTTFIVLNSIGVSKESQTRAAKIMEVVCDSYQRYRFDGSSKESELFFEYSRGILKERWQKLREVVKQSDGFIVPKFQTAYCNFTNQSFETYPAFAWLMCKREEDCGSYLEKKLKVVARSGKRFGSDPRYARINMLTTGDDFDEFLERLSNIEDI
ncbi:L-tryptophan--pyruvate aminotransferase 1-like [Neltuma alba]|uniref:L-tryptophan--pyruvate aminotransferase 1-like n=1 Tax=Neltuma alba TaxID=207710 RepID=UPI0010A45F0C|nr:L-tryptophan--pyruvate aminotransferase 1-like [Prosopis alba]